MSTISTFSPMAASAVPRLIAVVVLPTPPFWLATARIRGGGASGTGKAPELEDSTFRIAATRDEVMLESPVFPRLGQFGRDVTALQKQPCRAGFQQRFGETQQPRQR